MKSQDRLLVDHLVLHRVREFEANAEAFQAWRDRLLASETALGDNLCGWIEPELEHDGNVYHPAFDLVDPTPRWFAGRLETHLLRGLLVAAEVRGFWNDLTRAADGPLFPERTILEGIGISRDAEEFDRSAFLDREIVLDGQIHAWIMADIDAMPARPNPPESTRRVVYDWMFELLREYAIRGWRIMDQASKDLLGLSLGAVAAVGKARAASGAVTGAPGRQDAPLPPPPPLRERKAGGNRPYRSHCWKCGMSIDSEKNNKERCPRCNWYHCVACHACGCGFRRGSHRR